MVQMAFCDLLHTFHKQVTNVSQHVFVILLWGILMSPLSQTDGAGSTHVGKHKLKGTHCTVLIWVKIVLNDLMVDNTQHSSHASQNLSK